MITDPDQLCALSNLGWVDHGALWAFDAESERPRLIQLEGARHLSLIPGTGGWFAIVHHFGGARFVVTAHRFESPEVPLARIDVRGWSPIVSGRGDPWTHLPRAFVGYLSDQATGAAGYFVVRIFEDRAELNRLDWFTGARGYDLMYQSVVGVLELSSGELLFGVQRSSHLVRCSSDGSHALGEVVLTGHVGNPIPRRRQRANEVLAVDYDVLVCVDPGDWRVVRDFDGGSGEGKRHFVGDAWWSDAEDTVLVPRPAAGDIVEVGMEDFKVKRRIPIGRQPLQAARLDGGVVVARDWKTGDTLLARS